MNGPLDPYRRSKYSQHGEDGILEFLIGKLGITEGWCFEFGAADGTRFSNTLALIEQGWHALYAEPDPYFRPALQALAKTWPNLAVMFAWIGYGEGEFGDVPIVHIERALHQHGFPTDFDVLSIDAEGLHHPIWASVRAYRPRIVIAEIDSSHISYMLAMIERGRHKEYTCLGHCGNLVFVRNEDFDRLGIARSELEPLESLYTPAEPDW